MQLRQYAGGLKTQTSCIAAKRPISASLCVTPPLSTPLVGTPRSSLPLYTLSQHLLVCRASASAAASFSSAAVPVPQDHTVPSSGIDSIIPFLASNSIILTLLTIPKQKCRIPYMGGNHSCRLLLPHHLCLCHPPVSRHAGHLPPSTADGQVP